MLKKFEVKTHWVRARFISYDFAAASGMTWPVHCVCNLCLLMFSEGKRMLAGEREEVVLEKTILCVTSQEYLSLC